MDGGSGTSAPSGAVPGGPVRTCIGCRSRADRSHLVRIVLAPPARVVVDESASAPGRGAWLHPERACLDQAVRRRAFGRALRAAGPVDADDVTWWFVSRSTDGEGSSVQERDESGLEADGHPMSTQR
ncbi:MAG: YlxR family protein [Actinomycetaceae bacterium]